MIQTRPIHGIVPVVVTPLTREEEIDVQGLEKLIHFLTGLKIGGLWVLGTGSEDMNLTFEKRLTVARTVTAANNGKVPIVLGTGFFAFEDIMNFIEATSNLNFDAYHVMPYHPLLSLDRLEWFYRTIADSCPKPLWLYTSGNWCRSIPPDFVARLKDHPNIAGIKFSNTNAVAVTRVASFTGDAFQVITAVAGQLHACLAMGSKGHTSSLASALPETMIEIYQLFQQGKMAESLAAQNKLSSFLTEFSTCTKKDNFLQGADEKFILSLRGICQPYVTSYYRETSREEQQFLKDLLQRYGYPAGI